MVDSALGPLVQSMGMPYKDPEKRRAAQRAATARWYRSENGKQWREENRATVLAEKKEWWQENREQQLVKKKLHYQKNQEALRAKQAAYNKANREQIRIKAAARRQTNGDQINARKRQKYWTDPEARARMLEINRRWNERNPDSIARRSRDYAARRWGDTGQITSAEWEARVAEHDGRCAYCGQPATTQDHVIPLSRGGRHELANVVPACRSCNCSKRDKLMSEWQPFAEGR